MSHQPERKNKNCLNCGVMVKGRFCQRCGQENIVTKQSAWSLTKHFIFDIFHFDGKFFDTLGTLFRKPGLVAKDYVSGKRTKYLDPVRMYLFTSAVFFLIFFYLKDFEPVQVGDIKGVLSKTKRMDAVMELHARDMKDSLRPVEKRALNLLLDSTLIVEVKTDSGFHADSTVIIKGKPFRVFSQPDTSWYSSNVKPGGWLETSIRRKLRQIVKKNKDDPDKALQDIGAKVFHRLPYMLFVSLPFFALILKLIYFRRKQFYYSDHIVFTLYHYIFSFLLLLVLMGFVEIYKVVELKIFIWLTVAGIFYWLYYLYRGLRSFYAQGRAITIAKFLLLNMLGLVVFIFLILVFILFSFIQF